MPYAAAESPPRSRTLRDTLRWNEHIAAILCYAALSIVISWPTVAHFTTALTSTGGDARHELYLLWHTQQVLLGRQPLFEASLLYYPLGTTLLTHSTGPVTGLVALPFWLWGPAAAFNGTLLAGLTLSGYAMFLLARDVGLESEVAFFAGCFVLAAPMTLAGLPEHLTKSFTAGMPLVLLALRRALNPHHHLRWTLVVGLALLFVLLHNGYQFIYIALACGVMGLATLLGAPREQRRTVIGRIILAALSALALCAPLLIAILRASHDPTLLVAVNPNLPDAPDLLQFLLPDRISALFGTWSLSILQPDDAAAQISHETAVSLPWIGLILAGLGMIRDRRRVWPWLLLALLCVIFGLGPELYVRGQPLLIGGHAIRMPYAYLRQLPGLEFMRTPGRFMQVGVIGLGIGAACGLAWLVHHLPRWRGPLLISAPALLLLQIWPRPFPAESLRPTPPFYQQIANDPAQYGVFDLPLKPAAGFSYGLAFQHTSSFYQIYQITHGKGIDGGYVSRTYARHPIFNALLNTRSAGMSILRINGQISAFASFQDDLAQNGYRYVVLHKDQTQMPDTSFAPGYESSRQLLDVAFAGQQPLVNDAWTTVYPVIANSSLHLSFGQGWRTPESKWCWATSPATLEIESPAAQTVQLQITSVYLHDPQSPSGIGSRGILTVQVGDQPAVPLPMIASQPSSLPITLVKGQQTITLTLEAGNFQPSRYGSSDQALLSFAVSMINIVKP